LLSIAEEGVADEGHKDVLAKLAEHRLPCYMHFHVILGGVVCDRACRPVTILKVTSCRGWPFCVTNVKTNQSNQIKGCSHYIYCPIMGLYIYRMEKEPSSKILINLRVDRELAEAGKALAKKRGANLSTLLRMLLIKELDADKSAAK
jgi:hypothetical protein